jgi:hypothetical protein
VLATGQFVGGVVGVVLAVVDFVVRDFVVGDFVVCVFAVVDLVLVVRVVEVRVGLVVELFFVRVVWVTLVDFFEVVVGRLLTAVAGDSALFTNHSSPKWGPAGCVNTGASTSCDECHADHSTTQVLDSDSGQRGPAWVPKTKSRTARALTVAIVSW